MLSYSTGTWLRLYCCVPLTFHSSLECHFSYTLNWISYLSGYSDQLSSRNNLTGRTVHFCIHLMACIPSWQGSHWGLSFWCLGHVMQTVNRKSDQAIKSQIPSPVNPLPLPRSHLLNMGWGLSVQAGAPVEAFISKSPQPPSCYIRFLHL